MSLTFLRPPHEALAWPLRSGHAPQLQTATFHETRRFSLRDLIHLGPRPPVAVSAWDRANAPDAVAVAEVAPPKNWRRHIGSARLSWNKLSSGELERVDGDQAKLVKLLLRHYPYDRHEAGRLVRSFFERNRI